MFPISTNSAGQACRGVAGRRSGLLLASLAIGLLMACSHGADPADGTPAGAAEPAPPVLPDEAAAAFVLTASLPAAGAQQIIADVTPMFGFNRAVDPATAIRAVTLTNAAGIGVPGAVTVTGNLVQFRPDAPLVEGGQYTLAASTALTDIDGKALAETASVSFTVVPSAGQVAGKLFIRNGDRTIRVFDTATQAPVGVIETAEWLDSDRPMKVDAEGKRLYLVGNGNRIVVVDIATHSELEGIDVDADVQSFDLSPDGALVHVAAGDRQLLTFDAQTGSLLRSVTLPVYPWGLDVSPDGRFAYVGDGETGRDIHVMDLVSGDLVATLADVIVNGQHNVAFNPARPLAYASTSDPTTGSPSLSKIDTTTHTVVATIPSSHAGSKTLWPTADGNALYVSRTEYGVSTVLRVDAQTLALQRVSQAGFQNFSGWWADYAEFDPAGALYFSAGRSTAQAEVFDSLTGRLLAVLGPIDAVYPARLVFVPAAP